MGDESQFQALVTKLVIVPCIAVLENGKVVANATGGEFAIFPGHDFDLAAFVAKVETTMPLEVMQKVKEECRLK